MGQVDGWMRRAAAGAVGACSVTAGLAGAWVVTGSGALQVVPTPILLGLLGLTVLPLAMLLVWRQSAGRVVVQTAPAGAASEPRRSAHAGAEPERERRHRHRARHANA